MELTRRRRIAVASATVVLLVVVAGIALVVRYADRGQDRSTWPPPDLGSIPSQVWSLNAERVPGHDNHALLALPQTLDAYYGYAAVLDAPTVVVGALGLLTTRGDADDSRRVESVALVGIDRMDGSVRWERPVGRVRQCSDDLASGVIACWDDQRVLFVDTSDGQLLSETWPGMANLSALAVDDLAYINGVVSEGDQHNLIVTAGPPSTPGSLFRHTLPVPGPVSGVTDILPSGDVVVATNLNPDSGVHRFTVNDSVSGRARFVLEANQLQTAGNGLFLISGSPAASGDTQQILDKQGTPVSTAAVRAYTDTSRALGPAGDSPVLMGDGAYDPDTGRLLWRNPLLLRPADSVSAVLALAGRTAIVAAQETGEIVGFDFATGAERWRTPWRDAYWVYGGMTDGRHYVFSDYTGIHSLRIADGVVVWSVPLPEGADPRATGIANSGGNILVTSGPDITLWRGEPI